MHHITSNDLLNRVLYRDDDIIVLNKPAGIAVHKGRGEGGNLEALFPALTFGMDRNPALAHRLDKETSGCLILGRHRKALAHLGKLFQRGAIAKTYYAIVVGNPPDEGRIDLALARRTGDKRSWIMKPAIDGDPSSTLFKVLGRGDGLAWLELQPLTGRTHQLRVHCAASGFPIAGDTLYGGDTSRAAARMVHLHAQKVIIPQKRDQPALIIQAPVPEHMHTLFEACGFEIGSII
jgi:tRNA pseudouridine32 synthase / 23S rRNA pseudouridine746 synthase